MAGRIRERYHHPVYVVTKGEHGLKGSGRSIPAYSMYEHLVPCGGLLSSFAAIPWQQACRFRRKIWSCFGNS